MARLLSLVTAWGPDGHTIVAHIAEHYLSPDVDNVLRTDLLGDTLSHASGWNDDYDHSPEGEWSRELHFIDYPGRTCKFDWAKNCQNDWCLTGAIVNYSKQVFDPSLSKDDRFFALKFLIHMVGDVHQPLHVASGDDHGGNSIKLPRPQFSSSDNLQWSRHGTNLHSVWDGVILKQDIHELEAMNMTLKGARFVPHYDNWQILASELENRLDGEWASNKLSWESTVTGSHDEGVLRAGLSIVAGETASRGCEYAYNYADGSPVQAGDVLGREYYLRARPIVEEQLAKGGVRLAQLLKEALEQSRLRVSEIVI